MFARILALLLTTSYLLLATPAFAQTSTPTASSPNPYTLYPVPSSVSPPSPLYTDRLVNNLFHTFSCLAIGQSVIGQPCLTYQMTKNAQGVIQGIPVLSQTNLSGGTLGMLASVIDALYINPPVRTGDYLASVGQGLGIVKEAKAQGVTGSGAKVLSPILQLWQVSRNIAYVIMIIIFLIIGLMIMFRNKINPQTVITAQTALPGLVIGLILITFSYFLAGLITDVAFIGINLVAAYFSAAQGGSAQDLVAAINSQNILTIFSKFIGVIGVDDMQHVVSIIMDNASANVANFIRFAAGLMAFQYGNQIGHLAPVVGDIVGIITGLATAGGVMVFAPQMIGLVISWVVMVILIYSMFKLLLRLINNYLTIIFLTLTAPFQFLAASLPGRQGLATNWMLNMLANVLAFPAVLLVLYFVAYLLDWPLDNAPFIISGSVKMIGPNTLPLLGGLDVRFINNLLAFGALVALPAIPEVINRSVGRMGAAGQLLGQELSGNVRGGRGFSNQGQQLSGGIQKIGQDITTFKGTLPGYSPAIQAGMEQKEYKIFGRTFKPFKQRGAGGVGTGGVGTG
mgnify:FL=1